MPSSIEELPEGLLRQIDGIDVRPIVLIPGFASTRLRTWHDPDSCFSRIEWRGPADAAWLNVPILMGAPGCWTACMRLSPNQYDHPECRVRTDEGLDAITELDPVQTTPALTHLSRLSHISHIFYVFLTSLTSLTPLTPLRAT